MSREAVLEADYHVNLSIQFSNKIIPVNGLIDSGSLISFIKSYLVEAKNRQIFELVVWRRWRYFSGKKRFGKKSKSKDTVLCFYSMIVWVLNMNKL